MNPTVGILGSGAAGLITAHTLLKDGFNIEILSRDPSPGGVWAKHRVFDGLTANK
jgi:cation diffusion facilitator CzcD-associated flavoprotein CzcO